VFGKVMPVTQAMV